MVSLLDRKEECYQSFKKEKKHGVRILWSIDKGSGLYLLQKNLNKNFLLRIPLAMPAIGFVRGRSYQDYLRPHCGKRFHLRLDIQDFFGSISERQVARSLEEFVQDQDIIQNICDICMLEGSLPQGAVTSPALSNIVFRQIDQRILKYCQSIRKVRIGAEAKEEDIVYTRYADDMMFSSDYFDFGNQLSFYKMVKHILREHGFRINHSKTYMTEGEISLSGFVIGTDVHLSRKRLREINQILAYFDKRKEITGDAYEVDRRKIKDGDVLKRLNEERSERGFSRFINKKSCINYLCGYRAFLITFLKDNPEQTDSIKALEKKVRHLEQLIKQCQKIWFHIS